MPPLAFTPQKAAATQRFPAMKMAKAVIAYADLARLVQSTVANFARHAREMIASA